jgi:hypothetical protein
MDKTETTRVDFFHRGTLGSQMVCMSGTISTTHKLTKIKSPVDIQSPTKDLAYRLESMIVKQFTLSQQEL